MAAHSLSIAKASLLASCLRPDPNKLSRDELTQFHTLLETNISRCTPTNIQNTKQWLLQHVLPSTTRTAAFSKYLNSLSKNIDFLPQETIQIRSCRRQLHLLYLLNDVFHHVKYHAKEGPLRKHVREHIPPILSDLFTRAAEGKKIRTIQRLNLLLEIWEKERYCDQGQVASLRDVLSGNTKDSKVEGSVEVKTTKELPWILPATHGDLNAPFFDLPAANFMPHIVPNSSKPIRPDHVRALQLTAGPADESLVNAMKDFLKDVESIDDPYAILEDEGVVADIDEMGQISYRNEADDMVGDTYYGWSRAFCEKMKTRGKESENHDRSGSRSPGSSRSRSRSRSRSSRKRRHYSSSRSRSRSPYHDGPPAKFGSKPRRPSPPKSSSRSYSPDRPQFQSTSHIRQYRPAVSHQNTSMPQFSPPPPFPVNQHGSSPPRPPNWQGPWPPPPPPPPSSFAGNFNMPLPPPPPQNFGDQSHARR